MTCTGTSGNGARIGPGLTRPGPSQGVDRVLRGAATESPARVAELVWSVRGGELGLRATRRRLPDRSLLRSTGGGGDREKRRALKRRWATRPIARLSRAVSAPVISRMNPRASSWAILSRPFGPVATAPQEPRPWRKFTGVGLRRRRTCSLGVTGPQASSNRQRAEKRDRCGREQRSPILTAPRPA